MINKKIIVGILITFILLTSGCIQPTPPASRITSFNVGWQRSYGGGFNFCTTRNGFIQYTCTVTEMRTICNVQATNKLTGELTNLGQTNCDGDLRYIIVSIDPSSLYEIKITCVGYDNKNYEKTDDLGQNCVKSW